MPEGTGKVTFATSLISYFNIFAQLGIPTYGIRAVAQVRDDKEQLSRVTQELLIINLITTALSYIALAVTLIAVPRFYDDRMLYIIISFTLILNTLGIEWLYKGLEQYTYITMRSMIFKVIALVAMFLLVHEKSDYVIYGAISIFAASASNVLNFVNAHKYITLHSVGHYDFRRHLKPVFVFFAMSCATTIYTNLDNVMLGIMTTSDDVGYYSAAVKIKTVLVSLVTSLGAVLLPRASYYIEKNEIENFKNISIKALHFVMFAAIPLMVYFMIYAKESILFLSGDAFVEATVPMQIIMPTLLFIGITNILGIQILVPLGKENVVLYSEIAGAIVDFIINLLLIPQFKSAGAAAGTLAAEAVVLVVQYIYIRKEMKEILNFSYSIKILFAVVIAAVPTILFGTMINQLFMMFVVTACIFFILYYVILLLFKDNIAIMLFSQIIGKLKH